DSKLTQNKIVLMTFLAMPQRPCFPRDEHVRPSVYTRLRLIISSLCQFLNKYTVSSGQGITPICLFASGSAERAARLGGSLLADHGPSTGVRRGSGATVVDRKTTHTSPQ